MGEHEVLIWAAGGSSPADPRFDEERLVVAAREHQIEVRLHARLVAEAPAWASPGFVSKIAELADEARAAVRGQFAELADIGAHCDCDSRPLLSKGMSYYLLTNDELMVRRSLDLDLFSHDLAGLRATLEGLGYVTDAKNPPEPSGRRIAHEYAKLSGPTVEVDLHRFFPVWGYPRAAHHDDRRCFNSMVAGRIEIDLLHANSEQPAGLAGLASVSNAEMTALVSCCHIFANYVTEFPRSYARVKLAEVACLRDLIRSPSFDRVRFDELIAEVGAQDAVAFVFALFAEWFGDAFRAPDSAAFPGDPVPPRSLWFARGEGGFVVSTSAVEKPDDLVVRTTTGAELIRHLHPTTVLASRGSEAVWYDVAGGQRRPDQVLWHAVNVETFRFRFAVDWTDEDLRVLIDVFTDEIGAEVDLLFYFGTTILEAVEHDDGSCHVYDRNVEQRITDGSASFTRMDPAPDAAVRYLTVISWGSIADSATTSTSIPILLGLRRWALDGRSPVGGAMVPLEVCRTS